MATATPTPVYLLKHVNMVLKIFKMIATSGFLAALECTKLIFGQGSAPDPALGAYSAPQTPYSYFKGPYF